MQTYNAKVDINNQSTSFQNLWTFALDKIKIFLRFSDLNFNRLDNLMLVPKANFIILSLL